MIIETYGDILDKQDNCCIMLQQVNCFGLADVGMPNRMKKLFPDWYSEYRRLCEIERNKLNLLGTIFSYSVRPNVILCSAFTQFDVSKNLQATDYGAWNIVLRRLECEIKLKNYKDNMNWHIAVPHMIGCDYGGGDWNVMMDLFKYFFENSSVLLKIVKRCDN